ncbi:MAG: amidohydrolase family protein [Myxococcaceae bacterium]|nr:amidohydrolase family protein [Myxococcaceae bacterium]
MTHPDDEPAGCAHAPFLPRAGLDDAEGDRVPDGVTVVDAHVHLFPPGMFDAIWRWFDAHAWPVRYRLHSEEVIAFLRARGVSRFCALHYAHKPGLSALLNRYVAELAAAHRDFVIPLGTVLPGEPGAEDVLREALGPLGLRGIKLHCHVQRMGADDPRIDPVYAGCQDAGVPVVIHSGREPSSPAYGVDTRALCAVDQVERVLQRYPRLKLVVPHLGADEFAGYLDLLDRYENLWLDTTMAIAGYFPGDVPADLFPGRASRLLYGTDFPNLPYAWDRELRRLLDVVPAAERAAVLSGNALALFQ